MSEVLLCSVVLRMSLWRSHPIIQMLEHRAQKLLKPLIAHVIAPAASEVHQIAAPPYFIHISTVL